MSDPVGPWAHLKAAASGDVDAQRLLSRKYGQFAAANGGWAATFESHTFARLAYAQTGEERDAGLLVAQLAFGARLAKKHGIPTLQAIFEGESLAVLSREADKGVALADDHLPKLMAEATPEAAMWAKRFRELMDEAD